MNQVIRIQPNGPLLFRDGRPFTAGSSQARTLPFPYPASVAGTVRAVAGEQAALSGADWKQVLSWPVHGPLFLLDDQAYFPAPADALWFGGQLRRQRPIAPPDAGGTDIVNGLVPVGLSGVSGKPDPAPGLWPASATMAWLADEDPGKVDGFTPDRDPRTHVKMDPTSGAGEVGMLFGTEGLVFNRDNQTDRPTGPYHLRQGALLVRADIPAAQVPDLKPAIHRIGGEGRFATFTPDAATMWPASPPTLAATLARSKRIKLQLATPGAFARGWLPAWLDETTLSGCPPSGPEGLVLTLKAAAVPRWVPVSGWDLVERRPKPTTRLAPAGSVYFFELNAACTWFASNGWLAPVSDDRQKRDDGFGLALWGTW